MAFLAACLVTLGFRSAGASSGGLRIAAESMEVLSPEPPIMADRFHTTFTERNHGLGWGAEVTNTGSFHYDYIKGRQVWSHGKGQSDNWCQCAGLKTDEQCDLVATKELGDPSGATYAMFRTLNKCCKIGEWDHGFSPIRPDWLRASNATFVGMKKVGNRSCSEWAGGPPGDWFTMVSDNWSLDDNGVPCMYQDTFKFFWRMLGLKHTITFDGGAYSTAPEADDVFSMSPGMDCSQECPNTKGWCKAR